VTGIAFGFVIYHVSETEEQSQSIPSDQSNNDTKEHGSGYTEPASGCQKIRDKDASQNPDQKADRAAIGFVTVC
jgi:hypothetical protein